MRLLLCSLLLLISSTASAQTDSLTIANKPAFGSSDLYDLASFQGIDGLVIDFRSAALTGKVIELSYQVFDSGKATEKGVLTTGLPTNFFEANADSFLVKCLSQVRGDSVKVVFHYPRFQIGAHFTLRGRGDDYRLRFVAGKNGRPARIPLSKDKVAIMAYSLPYEPEKGSGRKFYCELTATGVPPSQWWEKYGVPHCIVFSVRIV